MIVYYAALSLDGRIAGPDHDLSFLQTLSRGPNGDYERFLPAGPPVERFAGDLRELVQEIASRGLERTWLVGGGDLAGRLLAADLLDELILTFAPTFVGRGPALADGEFPLRRFRPLEISPYGDDGVRVRYERARA